MNIVQLMEEINWHWLKNNSKPIEFFQRPSRGSPNKTTSVVKCGNEELCKSISPGAIHFFLRGMYIMATGNLTPIKIDLTPGEKIKRTISI